MNGEGAGIGERRVSSSLRAVSGGGVRAYAAFAAALSLLFAPLLAELIRFTLAHDVHSYVVLVPFTSAWLVWTRRRDLPELSGRPNLLAAVVLLAGAPAIAYGLRLSLCAGWSVNDRLSLAAFVYVATLLSGAAVLVGARFLRAVLGPALFLFFMVPMPSGSTRLLSVGLQHASADTLHALLCLTPIPVFRDGTAFHFPGLTLRVAEECSGIRSTVALFVTSVAGGMLFLHAPWRRSVLAACVFPIAALRNAARILTLAVGALYVDPAILEGPVHKRGGPPFFVLSLIPLFGIMILLYRGERRRKRAVQERVS